MDGKRKRKRKEKNKRNEKKRKGKEERKENEENKREEENLCVKEKGKKKGFDSWGFNSRESLVRELKLVYSTRATSRCQNHKEVRFSPTLVPLNLREWSWFSPNHGTEFLNVGTVF